jgi:hypothetical protein
MSFAAPAWPEIVLRKGPLDPLRVNNRAHISSSLIGSMTGSARNVTLDISLEDLIDAKK